MNFLGLAHKGVIKMSNYTEIVEVLKKFFDNNIDKLIGELTLNEVSQLADDLDSIDFKNHRLNKKTSKTVI
jgi:hypothetical protein